MRWVPDPQRKDLINQVETLGDSFYVANDGIDRPSRPF